MNTDPTTPRHEAIIGALSRDVEMLKREKLARISNDWVYWGSYPTDPYTTVDSPAWTNSWGNTGGAPTPTEPTRFRLAPDGNLEIEGSFEGGISGDAMGTIGAAWRPDYPKTIIVVSHGTSRVPYAVDIGTDGVCKPWEILLTGPTGLTGTTGATGPGAGIKYTYSNDTANTDPTSGKLKFDSTTLSAITSLRISETDGDANSIAAVIQSWDDSTSTVRATITIVKEGAPSNILILQVTGTITDNGTWDSCAITYVASSGSFANGDAIRVLVSRTGDKGDTGTAGTNGTNGTNGTSGADGGIKYTYSNDTANTDPTSGKLKFDSTTLSAITSLRISETDGDSNSIAALIQSWDDSTSVVRATITIVKQGAPSNLLVFEITGAITDNGTWDSCGITFIASSGSFANGDTVRVLVSRTGDKGDTGAAGAAGSLGGDSLFMWLYGR